jgi:PAS domain S-box-containing protein
MNMVTTFITPSVERTRGFTLEEIKTMKLEEHLAPESLERAHRVMAELLTPENLADAARKISIRLELEFYRKDGSTFWSENVLSLLRDAAGAPMGVLGVGRDISDRKAVEDKLRMALAEKDYLLREIHHRVKNNMMVIYSLLGLQSGYVTDPRALEALKESQTKISSMIKLYDQLNRSAGASHPDVGTYIRALTDELFSAYNAGEDRIRLHTEIDDVPLDVKRSFYAGLIINELVGNSLKHAFGHAGTNADFLVRVSMKLENANVRLVVADNGAGMPEERHAGASRGFGLNMVAMLVRQMAGTMDISLSGGTSFNIRFPLQGNDAEQ